MLEYRVWVHPHDGGEDLYDGDDYYCAFATFEEASAYSRETAGAEQPLVLVRQDECINEAEPGRYEHHTGERLTEWRVEWLEGSKRTPSSIPDFPAAPRQPGPEQLRPAGAASVPASAHVHAAVDGVVRPRHEGRLVRGQPGAQPARSCGVPSRPTGTLSTMRSSSAGGKALTVSSAMKPGDTRLTVTPRA